MDICDPHFEWQQSFTYCKNVFTLMEAGGVTYGHEWVNHGGKLVKVVDVNSQK